VLHIIHVDIGLSQVIIEEEQASVDELAYLGIGYQAKLSLV
jgi:hypothetical protein